MPKALGSRVLSAVRTRVPAPVYSTWFKPLKPLELRDGTLYVLAPNPMARTWIAEHYGTLFPEVLGALGVADGEVVLVDQGERVPGELTLTAPAPKAAAPAPRPAAPAADPDAVPLNPSYRFDGFIEGPSNRFAFAAASAVAQNPAKAYNPLYIYGGVGLGKTHLMQSIAGYLRQHAPGVKVVYLSAERFTNEMISSIAHKQQHEFRERYRRVDVLLLDDVQFLKGKMGTQEELFHTFNALHEAQKQVVISSDCHPRELQEIEERLRSRFEWGLIADIQPPELETKVAILHKKAEAHGLQLPEDVALYIASHVNSNIRELEGCLVRLVAFSSFKGLPIDLELARQTFETLFRTEGRVITVEAIQKHVAAAYRLQAKDLKSKTNKAEIVLPRQVAMYLCKELTDASLPEIGRKFGGKHHSTVLHSIRKVEERMGKDGSFAQRVKTFLASFQ